MRKGAGVFLLIMFILGGSLSEAAIKLTGFTYSYPASPEQDQQLSVQDPERTKLTDGRIGMGSLGAVSTAEDQKQAFVLFDLGQLPAEYLINQLRIRTSETSAGQHIGEIELYTSTDLYDYRHLVTVENPEPKLEAEQGSPKIYSFGTEYLALKSRYVLLVFSKAEEARGQVIEEVEFWARETEKLTFSYSYPSGSEQDSAVPSQDPELKKLNDGGMLWGGGTAIFGGWGAQSGIQILFDLGQETLIRKIALWTSERNPDQHLGKVRLYTSADGQTFSAAIELTNPEPPLAFTPAETKLYAFELEALHIKARFIKLVSWRDPAALQQVLEEVELWGNAYPPIASKQIPSASIKSITVNTFSSVKVDLGGYFLANPDLNGCRVYVGEDFFNDAAERLAYENWWWLDEERQQLLISGLTPGEEYYIAVGGDRQGRTSRCLRPVAVRLPDVLTTAKVGDVLGINAFPYFASGAAHNPRPEEEEKIMFQRQLAWVKEAKIKYNRWWFFISAGVKPYLDIGATFITWMQTDPEKIKQANNLGIWLFASSNEPNFSGISPQQCVAKLQECYQAMKAVNPKNIMAAPVVGIDAEDWLRQFYEAGGKEYFDVCDFHVYQQKSLPVPQGLAPGSPEGVLLQLARLKQIMAEYGDEAKPIIITETGCPTYSGYDWAVGSTLEMQANFVVRAHVLMLASGVQRIFWYALQDEGTDPDEMEENFGLVDYEGNPKPAYFAYQTMSRQLGETIYRSPIAGLANPSYGYSFEKLGGGFVSCLWDARGQSTVTLQLADGQVALVRQNGERQVLPNPTGILTLTVSEAPLYLHSAQPLKVISVRR